MVEWWPSSGFFSTFMDRDGVEVHKHAKNKGTRPIFSHLERNSLSTSVGIFLWYLEDLKIFGNFENLGIFRNIHSFLFGLALCFPPIPLKQDSDGFMPQTIQFSDFPREKCFPYQSKHGRTKFQKWRILVTSKGPNLLHSSHYKTF